MIRLNVHRFRTVRMLVQALTLMLLGLHTIGLLGGVAAPALAPNSNTGRMPLAAAQKTSFQGPHARRHAWGWHLRQRHVRSWLEDCGLSPSTRPLGDRLCACQKLRPHPAGVKWQRSFPTALPSGGRTSIGGPANKVAKF